MKTIKRVVTGIDFSDYSPQILEYASWIAERCPAEIIAVNVINQRRIKDVRTAINDSHFSAEIVEKFINDEKKKRTQHLAELLRQWVSKKVSSRKMIRTGIPFEEILKVVDEEDAELVVINSRGRTNFQDYMFGTTAEKIFRHSPVCVLSLNFR